MPFLNIQIGSRSKAPSRASKMTSLRPMWVGASSSYVKETRMLADAGGLGGNVGSANGIDGAKVSRKEGTWPTWPMTADQIVWRYWNTLVARSRECLNNNDHGRRYAHLVRDNVVGARGVRLKPIPRGADGKYDEEAADAISDAYDIFGKSPEVTGQHDMIATQKLKITSAAQDGEILQKKVYGADAGAYGFGIQLLDPFSLDPHYNSENKGDGSYIRASIEYNRAGRPIAYHMRRSGNDQWGYGTTVSYDRVPASEIIHSFVGEIVGQRRGLPWARTALQRLWHIKGFETAAVINARVSAAKLGFFRDPEGDSDGEEISMDAEPGVFEDIGSKEFVKVDWNWPVGEFEPFVKSCLRHSAAALNVANHSLTGDMSDANYSSLRVASMDEREGWMGTQAWFAISSEDKVYNAWLEYALLKGLIKTRSGRVLRPEDIENYRRVLWIGRRWAWIDPLKEVSANIQAITHRLKSRTQVIEEQGGDATTTWEQIAAEEEELQELGITLPVQGGGQQDPNLTTVGPDANSNDDPETESEPDKARLKAAKHDLAVMRNLHGTSSTILAEKERQVQKLTAELEARKESKKTGAHRA